MRLRYLFDTVLVLAFAAVGRSSHELGLSLLGVLVTAWPFLVGLAVGWLATFRYRTWWVEGLIVAALTVSVGMLLRLLTGGGTAQGFILTSSLVLVLGALGWRAIAVAISARGASEAERTL